MSPEERYAVARVIETRLENELLEAQQESEEAFAALAGSLVRS